MSSKVFQLQPSKSRLAFSSLAHGVCALAIWVARIPEPFEAFAFFGVLAHAGWDFAGFVGWRQASVVREFQWLDEDTVAVRNGHGKERIGTIHGPIVVHPWLVSLTVSPNDRPRWWPAGLRALNVIAIAVPRDACMPEEHRVLRVYCRTLGAGEMDRADGDLFRWWLELIARMKRLRFSRRGDTAP